jgi:hypothetical protein
MRCTHLLRSGVLLLPFLLLVALSGCPGSSGSGDGRGARSDEPERPGSDRDGAAGPTGGGMMGGGV